MGTFSVLIALPNSRRAIGLKRNLSHGQRTAIVRRFVASKGFIDGFRKPNLFCLRRCHNKRHSASDPTREKIWKTEVNNLLPVSPKRHHLIPNGDETSWKIYSKGIKM
jgi:hypothetical protein